MKSCPKIYQTDILGLQRVKQYTDASTDPPPVGVIFTFPVYSPAFDHVTSRNTDGRQTIREKKDAYKSRYKDSYSKVSTTCINSFYCSKTYSPLSFFFLRQPCVSQPQWPAHSLINSAQLSCSSSCVPFASSSRFSEQPIDPHRQSGQTGAAITRSVILVQASMLFCSLSSFPDRKCRRLIQNIDRRIFSMIRAFAYTLLLAAGQTFFLPLLRCI